MPAASANRTARRPEKQALLQGSAIPIIAIRVREGQLVWRIGRLLKIPMSGLYTWDERGAHSSNDMGARFHIECMLATSQARLAARQMRVACGPSASLRKRDRVQVWRNRSKPHSSPLCTERTAVR